MSDLGIDIPPLPREPSRAHAFIASGIWLIVSLPFFYLASPYWSWPASVFSGWRGWVFGIVATACVLMAVVVPPRHRVAIVGTRVRAWARLS
jgi:hypothetical protein